MLVHWPILSGWLTIDPIYRFSGLSKPVWMQGVLPGDAFIDGNAGVTTQALGTLSAQDWLHGVVPWWNPYSGIGLPLAGEMQSSSFFLPFILLLLLPAGLTLLKISLQVVAGYATFALLRQLDLQTSAALAGAIVFELNGTFAWIAHAPVLPVAFLPLLLLGIERAAAASRVGRVGGWRWITVSISYCLLAGFPEVAYLDGLLALAWTSTRAFTLHPHTGRFLLNVAIGGGAGLALAAPLLVAFADFLSVAYVGGHTGFADRYFLSPNMAMLLFPYVAGSVGNHVFWFTIGGYLGLPMLFLAVLGLLTSTYKMRWLLGVWLATTFAASVGVPGVTWLVEAVPLVRQTMFTNYIAPTWSMAVAILCAFAIDDWLLDRLRRRNVLVAAAIALTVGLGALFLSRTGIIEAWSESRASRVLGLVSIGWECALAALIARLMFGRLSRHRGVVLIVAVGTDAFASFTVPVLSGVANPPPLDTALIGFLRDGLHQSRFAEAGTLYPNYGAMFGVASINYNYLPNARHWVDHVMGSLDSTADQVNFPGNAAELRVHLPAYQDLGVRFIVLPSGADPGFGTRVMRTPTADIYSLADPAGYVSVVHGPCRLTNIDRDVVSAKCEAEASLTRRELYMPGWHAVVNGRDAAVKPSHGLFQEVDVSKGDNLVQFHFRPPHVLWADLLMMAGASVFGMSFVARLPGRTERQLDA